MSPLSHASPPSSGRELMSAAVDGEGDALQAALRWGDDADAREAWHTYHLIGDVLRSDDLAIAASRDAEFLGRLRARLAEEPAIVAPQPVAAVARAARARPRWAAPAAVAAGFVAVAGVLVVTRTVAPAGEGVATMAATSAASQVLSSGAAVVPVAVGATVELPVQTANGKLIRDARLDEYLRAHRGGPAAVPGGSIGRFETVVLER